MKTAKRLESERFGLPNKPTGTPEQLEELVRCGIGANLKHERFRGDSAVRCRS